MHALVASKSRRHQPKGDSLSWPLFTVWGEGGRPALQEPSPHLVHTLANCNSRYRIYYLTPSEYLWWGAALYLTWDLLFVGGETAGQTDPSGGPWRCMPSGRIQRADETLDGTSGVTISTTCIPRPYFHPRQVWQNLCARRRERDTRMSFCGSEAVRHAGSPSPPPPPLPLLTCVGIRECSKGS